ncbi:MAG: hypothetical protein ACYCTF_07490 [Acidiferrobacter sp.]
MKITRRLSRCLGGHVEAESSVLWSSRHGLTWTLGAFATAGLIGTTMALIFWTKGHIASGAGAGANRIVLTANAAPPALWSNAWLGRRPYRAVAFHGLRRFATGFSLVVPEKSRTLRQALMRMAPDIGVHLVRFKDELSSDAGRAFSAHAWL